MSRISKIEELPVGLTTRSAGEMGPWQKLFLGVVVLWMVMFGVGPMLLNLPWYGEMNRFIESEGIRSTAIYYTDLETFRDAEFDLRQNLEYGPAAPPVRP